MFRVLVIGVVAVLGLGLFVPWPRPHADVSAGARPLTCLTTALGRYGDSGRGWTGGDSTWSAELPGGRTVFAFSDTFLSPVTPPTRPAGAAFVHNSLIVRGPGGEFSTIVGSTADRPDSLLRPADDAHWFWLGAATYLGGALQIPLTEWRPSGPGALDIAFVGASVARFDADDLSRPLSVTPLPRGRGIQWGQWVWPEDGWTYVYGVEIAEGHKYVHVARVEGADLRGRFAFWTGRNWSASEADSARITSDVSAEFSVHRLGPGRYALITLQDRLGDHLYARLATTPTGPFGPDTTLYITPETGPSGTYHDPDVYTYNAHAHPEFSTPTTLVVSYNVNSLDTAPGGDVYRDITVYRPRFLTVPLPGDTPAPDLPARSACP
ncbi:hypothetical protein ACWDSJ_10350 [Nocardia sp. NPDC003482]